MPGTSSKAAVVIGDLPRRSPGSGRFVKKGRERSEKNGAKVLSFADKKGTDPTCSVGNAKRQRYDEPVEQPASKDWHPTTVQQAQEQQWRDTRYGRWQQVQQHSELGLGLALLRLALASLMHPRLAEAAPEVVTDVVGAVGEAVSRVVGFCGVLAGHNGIVFSAEFSLDGTKVVSASDDKTLRLWNVATGECEQTLAGHSSTVWSAGFSPDGTKVVSASDDKTLRLWNVATGECEQTLAGHSQP